MAGVTQVFRKQRERLRDRLDGDDTPGRADDLGHAHGVMAHVRADVEGPIARAQEPVEERVFLLVGEEAAAADLRAKEDAAQLVLCAGGQVRGQALEQWTHAAGLAHQHSPSTVAGRLSRSGTLTRSRTTWPFRT